MAANKNFFQDRTTLLLVSIESFIALFGAVVLALKINEVRGSAILIVQNRATPSAANLLRGVNGTIWDMAMFIVFLGLTTALAFILAYRVYKIRRELTMTVLSLNLVLQFFVVAVGLILLNVA